MNESFDFFSKSLTYYLDEEKNGGMKMEEEKIG